MTRGLKKIAIVLVALSLVIAAGVVASRPGAGTVDSAQPQAADSQTGESAVPWESKRPALGTTSFDAAKIQRVRLRAVKAVENTNEEPPKGWSKSAEDPHKILPSFEALRLKKGFVLHAYEVYKEGNGSGVVWALPADAEFPEPDRCPRVQAKNVFFHLDSSAPKPPAALDDAMEAVEGDGSAWSYLSASILARELGQFGARWYGADWQTHTVLDKNPIKPGMPTIKDLQVLEIPSGPFDAWEWEEPGPDDWKPRVQIEKEKVSVVFYTYSALHRQAIYRHTDIYKPGNYVPATQRNEIAIGPMGFFF
jgi:hypothetical protein